MQNSFFSILLIGSGLGGMLFTLTFDFFHHSASGFGTRQFAGFVVSAIVALAGLNKLIFKNKRLWDGLLLIAYLAGVLFWGLKPASQNHSDLNGILHLSSLFSYDFIINVLCFVPLSYLMMSFFLAGSVLLRKQVRFAIAIFFVGLGISLIIELLQYNIPGRDSSLTDLIANGLGTLGGIVFYFTERRFTLR